MASKKQTTIFKQLIVSIVLPVVIALVALGVINYQHNKQILVQNYDEKISIIIERIKGILLFQDFALELIESRLDERMQEISNTIVNDYLDGNINVEEVDLNKIREELGMSPGTEDIYIINQNGIIVNTTFERDLQLNLFGFGEKYKEYLLKILKERRFHNERFSIENNTKKLKKYSYQPTNDGKYIVELGLYSKEADEIIALIQDRSNNISGKQESIISVDLFIGAEEVVSFNQNAKLPDAHRPIVADVFKNKASQSIVEKQDNKNLTYEYIYMERNNSKLYNSAVIQIISDRGEITALLRNELYKFSIIFGITILSLILLTFNNVKLITKPIEKLLKKVNIITGGKLNERAEVQGNYEIATLAENFNQMIGELEKSHNELEQRVIERTAEISKQKEKIEAQNQDITDSIRYAKRIQQAILPNDHLINQAFPESFILYEPKDIVSGDFYWFGNKNDTAMIAAVDCTGHGVPGAFMSMIGYNLLNQIINENGITKPAEVLDKLHNGVRKALKQDEEDAETRDGMDLALCSINVKSKKIEYAGAYRPLYLLRDGEIIETKGDKFPIGGQQIKHKGNFTNHEIKVKKDDIVYIFTDGYADQFGGENTKKFMTKRFKEILLQIRNMTMKEQEAFLRKTINEWRGNIRQIDDILVIGLRF